MVANSGPRVGIERDGSARAADFHNTNQHLSGQNETGRNDYKQISSAVLLTAKPTLHGLQRGLFGLAAFVRHRARPPNVGIIVGSERRNPNHIMISMGLGGRRPSQPVRFKRRPRHKRREWSNRQLIRPAPLRRCRFDPTRAQQHHPIRNGSPAIWSLRHGQPETFRVRAVRTLTCSFRLEWLRR